MADFNQDILDWCNADYDRMERIGTDAARNDYIIYDLENKCELPYGKDEYGNYHIGELLLSISWMRRFYNTTFFYFFSSGKRPLTKIRYSK